MECRGVVMRLLVVAAVLVLLAAGCAGGDEDEARPTAPATGTDAAADDAVTITVGSRTDGSGDTGTFEITGSISDSGTFTTVDNRKEGGLDRTFKGTAGDLVLHVRLTEVGAGFTTFEWSVTSGTRAYAGARGSGEGEHRLSAGSFEGTLTGRISP